MSIGSCGYVRVTWECILRLFNIVLSLLQRLWRVMWKIQVVVLRGSDINQMPTYQRQAAVELSNTLPVPLISCYVHAQ